MVLFLRFQTYCATLISCCGGAPCSNNPAFSELVWAAGEQLQDPYSNFRNSVKINAESSHDQLGGALLRHSRLFGAGVGSTTLALRICHDADPSVQEVFRNISAGLHSCRHCPGFCGPLAVSMSRYHVSDTIQQDTL